MKLKDAEGQVRKLSDKAKGLQEKLGVAQAEEQFLEGRRAELERLAYGQDNIDAEGELEKTESSIAKCQARQRGVSAELAKVIEDRNSALEALRQAQLEADAVELRKVDKDIAKLEAELPPLLSRRVSLVAGRMDSASIEGSARRAEAEEVEEARMVFEGVTIHRTLTTTREA